MDTVTAYEHITLDQAGTPIIAGMRLTVADLAVAHVEWGWSAEEIAYQHPPLTLGQVYSALAYYWDHKKEVDSYLEEGKRISDGLRPSLPTFPRLAKIRAQLVNH